MEIASNMDVSVDGGIVLVVAPRPFSGGRGRAGARRSGPGGPPWKARKKAMVRIAHSAATRAMLSPGFASRAVPGRAAGRPGSRGSCPFLLQAAVQRPRRYMKVAGGFFSPGRAAGRGEDRAQRARQLAVAA